MPHNCLKLISWPIQSISNIKQWWKRDWILTSGRFYISVTVPNAAKISKQCLPKFIYSISLRSLAGFLGPYRTSKSFIFFFFGEVDTWKRLEHRVYLNHQKKLHVVLPKRLVWIVRVPLTISFLLDLQAIMQTKTFVILWSLNNFHFTEISFKKVM